MSSHRASSSRDEEDRKRRSGGQQRSQRTDDNNGEEQTQIDPTKKKFSGRCRLFIGNLVPDVKEDEIKKLVTQYGEVSECFLSNKGFGFVRLDTRAHAEAAKEALDNYMLHSRPMRLRFAVHGAAIRVKELSPYVSNEVLFQAFQRFGPVERAVHIVEERGRPTGEGIVEFERKHSATEALKQINDGVFLLSASPKPIIAEPLDPKDEDDGLAERMIPRTGGLLKEREQEPRFAGQGTFEFEFGNRWKELFQMEKVRKEQLDQELRDGRERLEGDMDLAYQDYQAELMRQELRRRQEELERLEATKRERMDLMRRREEDRMRQRQEAGLGYGYGGPPPPHFDYGGRQQQQQPLMPPPHHGYGPGPGGPGPGGYMPGPGPDGPPPGPGGGGPPHKPDENLVHGVQKLLQMFKGGQPPTTEDGAPGQEQGQDPRMGMIDPNQPGFQMPNMGMPPPQDDYGPNKRRRY